MTQREKFKKAVSSIDEIGKKGFISLGLSFLSYIVSVPLGETLFGKKINIQSTLSIFSAITFIYFLYWVYLEGKRLFLDKTMKYEVEITGETNRIYPEIKIQNKEPVNIEDIHVEMIRFSWHKSVWNDIDKFSVGDRFFSIGLPENRAASRSPIYVKIAEPVKGIDNLTRLLLDVNHRHMPLDNQGSEHSKWAEYEFVFRVEGRFSDKESSESFGDYHAILKHEQIQPHGDWARQDIFIWETFKKVNEKEQEQLKSEYDEWQKSLRDKMFKPGSVR